VADRIAYVLGRFPVLSETFIAREIRDLLEQGVAIDVYALVRQPQGCAPPEAERFAEAVTFRPPLPRLAAAHPLRLARHLLAREGRQLRSEARTGGAGWGMLAAGRVASACWLADRVGRSGAGHIHAHFLGAPAQVAYLASRILRLPFSVSAHASDAFVRGRVTAFERRIAGEAAAIVTCSFSLAEHLVLAHGLPSEKLLPIYHGIRAEELQVDRRPQAPPVVLAVGRLVEKKGFHHLITAMALLRKAGHRFRCSIVGEGPERPLLESLIADARLGDQVELLGARPFRDVVRLYGCASVLVAPSIEATDGDMDGLPNVLLEAAAARVPIVATTVSAIPELIRHEATGLLVSPHDAHGLAEAVGRILSDDALARDLAEAAHERVLRHFDSRESARRLAKLFETQSGAGPK